jgi:hypothetical protein
MTDDTRDALKIEDAVNEEIDATCPRSGEPIAADSLARYRGRVVGFRNPGCRDALEAAIRHFDAAIGEADAPLLAKGLA